MRKIRKIMSAVMVLCLLHTSGVLNFQTVNAVDEVYSDDLVQMVVEYYKDNWTDLSTIDEWWSLIALRTVGEDINGGEYELPDFSVLPSLTGSDGDKMNTLSTFILSAAACGYDVTDSVVKSAVTGLKSLLNNVTTPMPYSHPYALLALNAVGDNLENTNIISVLLNMQDKDTGGYVVDDVDVTGTAILALEPHKSVEGVIAALNKARECIKGQQLSDGGFPSAYGDKKISNVNTTAIAVMALRALGEDVFGSGYTKSGKTPVHSLLNFMDYENGAFVYANGINKRATEQALMALCSLGVNGNILQNLSGSASVINPVAIHNPIFYEYMQENGPVRVSLRVEGKQGTLYELKNIQTEKITLIGLLRELKEAGTIVYNSVDTGWGESIIDFNGVTPPAPDGGYGWWCIIANGVMANAGISDYRLKNNDDIVFYPAGSGADGVPTSFWADVALNKTSFKAGETIEITLSSTYETYDEFWNPASVTIPLEGVMVKLGNNITMTTDANGKANCTAPSTEGGYTLTLYKTKENDYPEVVKRYADFSVIDEGSGSGNNTGGGSGAKYVYLIVVDNEGGKVHSRKRYTMDTGETAYSLLLRSGLPVDDHTKGDTIYVKEIGGLREFDLGSTSGWKYAVQSDGSDTWKIPGESANKYALKNGDYLCWYYALTPNDKPDSLLAKNSSSKGGGDSGGKALASPVPSAVPVALSSEEKVDVKQVKALINNYKNISAKALEVLVASDSHDWTAYCYGLAGIDIPEGYAEAIKNLCEQERFSKVTDIERYILNYIALGLDASELLDKLYNHDRIDMQGVNGVAFALIAYDAASAKVSVGVVNTRESLIEYLLNAQNADGSFSLEKGLDASVDITGMVLAALEPYKNRDEVKKAVDDAFAWLSSVQLENFGFLSTDKEENSESLAWVVIARAMYKLPYDDYIAELMNYMTDTGEFAHVKGGGADSMATSQAILAIASAIKDMREKLVVDVSFADYADISDWAVECVDKAVELGIIKGDNGRFNPQNNVTRAELVAITLRGMGEVEDNGSGTEIVFGDVSESDWYYGAVTKAYAMGIINGTGPSMFEPEAGVTRQEAAVIVGRILKLSNGVDVPHDIDNCDEWAKEYVIQVFSEKIMTGDGVNFNPHENVTREMMVKIIMSIDWQTKL